jgi:hypothetical protein
MAGRFREGKESLSFRDTQIRNAAQPHLCGKHRRLGQVWVRMNRERQVYPTEGMVVTSNATLSSGFTFSSLVYRTHKRMFQCAHIPTINVGCCERQFTFRDDFDSLAASTTPGNFRKRFFT